MRRPATTKSGRPESTAVIVYVCIFTVITPSALGRPQGAFGKPSGPSRAPCSRHTRRGYPDSAGARTRAGNAFGRVFVAGLFRAAASAGRTRLLTGPRPLREETGRRNPGQCDTLAPVRRHRRTGALFCPGRTGLRLPVCSAGMPASCGIVAPRLRKRADGPSFRISTPQRASTATARCLLSSRPSETP